jgi:hypothetical protein
LEEAVILKDPAEYRGKNDGEKVFMIGNGPSLTYDRLDQLIPHNTYAMNNIAVAYPHTDWRPTYYQNVSIESTQSSHSLGCTRTSIIEAEHSYISSQNLPIVMSMATISASVSIVGCHKFPSWASYPDRCVSTFGGSMFAALQIAAFMGFSKMYLVGCDMNLNANFDAERLVDSSHFSPDYMGETLKKFRANDIKKSINDESNLYVAHKLAFMATMEMGIMVKTCNKSLKHVYPYIPFEEALCE